jgi:hypothetical protein
MIFVRSMVPRELIRVVVSTTKMIQFEDPKLDVPRKQGKGNCQKTQLVTPSTSVKAQQKKNHFIIIYKMYLCNNI